MARRATPSRDLFGEQPTSVAPGVIQISGEQLDDLASRANVELKRRSCSGGYILSLRRDGSAWSLRVGPGWLPVTAARLRQWLEARP